MRVTNKNNLPESMVRASGRSHRPDINRLSPSALCGPPMLRALQVEHYDDIEVDVSDSLMSMLGTGFHLLMEQNKPNNCMNEMPVSVEYLGYTINGIIDQYDPVKKIIRDYKTTSVWSMIDGKPKPEWVKQLNIYAWMLKENGMRVDNIFIEAIARDWVKSKAFQHGYPKSPYQRFELPVWDTETTKSYIEYWIRRYEEREPCTAEERWARDKSYAVMKKGRKSALRVLDSRVEAEEYMSLKGGDYIEERPGANARCDGFCNVNKFCRFWMEQQKG